MKCYMTAKPCDYFKKNIVNNKIFIISPFGFPYDSVYSPDGLIQKILNNDLNLIPHRSDQTMRLGSIMCQGICKEIIERQYLMVDISEPNPNVYYELGLAYALEKDIITLLNKDSENGYLSILISAWHKQQKTFIEYDNIANLEALVSGIDLDKTIKINSTDIEQGVRKKVLIIENGQSRISGLFERILEQSQTEFVFSEDLFKGLTAQERNTFKNNDWAQWEIETIKVTDETNLKDIVRYSIASAKICIIDTTSYKKINQPELNPYMYFFLGLAHGLEKEVIPMTNAKHTEVQPFDVKGLWQVFFSDEKSLKSGLLKIMPKISVDFHKEIIAAPYNKIWNGFLQDKDRLSIIYYGRPNTKAEQEKRGRRTNIDSWDSKTVSEASFYLAQKFPTTEIRPAPPEVKAQLPEDENAIIGFKKALTTDIKGYLKDKYTNCMIVGSPDVSDYAEVLLAKIYRTEPFDNKQKINDTDKRFVFYKHNLTDVVHSSFYRKVDKEEASGVFFFGDKRLITRVITYGVLTIAQNPYNDSGKILVLSGYTGIATFGLLRLIIDVHTDNIDNKIGGIFNNKLSERIIPEYDPDNPSPFSALVKFQLGDTKIIDESEKAIADISDNRGIVSIWVDTPK